MPRQAAVIDETTEVAEVDTDENLELIEDMLRSGEQAPEPEGVRVNDIIHSGDGTYPAPVVVKALQSAGYEYVYDRKTGDRSTINRNMRQSQLQKKHSDGSLAFTLKKPATSPRRGIIKCWLHPDGPNRKHYDDMGLPVCTKANFPNEFQRDQHCQIRHKSEWKTIENERIQKERDEDRAFQRGIINLAQGRK